MAGGRGEARGNADNLALNRAGKVPVLVARRSPNAPASVITQSSAILFYADEQAPGSLLSPQGSTSRIKVLEAFFYFTSDVIAANGIAFKLQRQGHKDAADLLTIAGFTIISAIARNLPWEQLPRLAAWRDRIGRWPAIREGMSAFD